jgi:hypothetical protein
MQKTSRNFAYFKFVHTFYLHSILTTNLFTLHINFIVGKYLEILILV